MDKIKNKGKLQKKFLRGLALLAVTLIIVLGAVISDRYRDSMEYYYSKIAFDQAKIASLYIDGDRIAEYASKLKKDDYYETVRQYLLHVKQTVGLKYYYVVIPFEDKMLYLWDAGDSGEEGICELGQWEDYYGNGQDVMRRAYLDPTAEDTILITNSKAYGYLASAYTAILNSRGEAVALASVDISIDMIEKEISTFLVVVVIAITIVLILFMISYFFFIRSTMLRPLHKLHKAAESIVGEQIERLDHFTIDIHTGDEIEGLAEAFEYMAAELARYIKNLTEVTAEKERIGVELNVATQIQANMLPGIFPPFPHRNEFAIYATMTPAKEVGGDFYDFFLVDEAHLALVIADVSGKGVPAALFMMIAKTLIKSSAQTGMSPKDILEKVNNQLCENNQAEMFVTVWLGILEIATGKMICANAGHEFPVIKRKDADFELLRDKHGFVLAGIEGSKYSEYEAILERGDRLYVYTDGVPEATDGNNNMYGLERMTAALNRYKDTPVEEMLVLIKQDIDRFVAGAPQFDDITMLTIEMKGSVG